MRGGVASISQFCRTNSEWLRLAVFGFVSCEENLRSSKSERSKNLVYISREIPLHFSPFCFLRLKILHKSQHTQTIMNMVDRIREIIKYSQMSQQDFAARISASAASLSNILNGKTNPSAKTVQGIHLGFPEINVNWLMFGEGDMSAGISSNVSDVDGETDGSEFPSGGLFGDAAAANSQPDGLFSANEQPAPPARQSYEPKSVQPAAHKDVLAENRNMRVSQPMAINIDKDARKIKEIRVFYSNGTYESFVPSSK